MPAFILSLLALFLFGASAHATIHEINITATHEDGYDSTFTGPLSLVPGDSFTVNVQFIHPDRPFDRELPPVRERIQYMIGEFTWKILGQEVVADTRSGGITFLAGGGYLNNGQNAVALVPHIIPHYLRDADSRTYFYYGPRFAGDEIVLTDISFSASAVPEPATWAMMLIGFAGIGFAVNRRGLSRPGAHAARA